MSTEKEEAIMLCTRVQDGPAALPSKKRNCFKCKLEVWVTPVSLKMAEERGCKFICPHCAIPALEEMDEVRLQVMPTKEQVEELLQHHRESMN